MSESTGSGSGSTSEREHVTGAVRELREYARGAMPDVDHKDVHPHAGLIRDRETREALAFLAEAYDPSDEDLAAGMPRDFWDTPIAQRAVRKHATNVATKAIRDANASQAAYMTGLPGHKSDVSGLHAVMNLAEWLVDSENCKLIYLAALMGRGKTDLSLLLGEIIADHYRRVERTTDDSVAVPTPEFAANFHADTPSDAPDVREINHYRELVEWMERGSSAEERWFIFDEASSELTAQDGGNAQKVVKRMGSLIKKMRKMGVNMIVIGHDKGDVHVAIRSLADFIDKKSLKSAQIYEGISNREPVGHLFDVDGLPPTSWDYDTDDTADWCWCDDGAAASCPHIGGEGAEPDFDGWTEDEYKELLKRRAVRLWQRSDLNQEEVADAVSSEPDDEIQIRVTQTDVSKAKKTMEREGTLA